VDDGQLASREIRAIWKMGRVDRREIPRDMSGGNRYLIFLRRSRGGCGIPYETAKAELISLFEENILDIAEEYWTKHRLLVTINLPPDEVKRRAELAGYIEAILSVHEEPYMGEELRSQSKGRWRVGWVRIGDRRRFQREIYLQDDEERLRLSPDKRPFKVEVNGKVILAKGHKHHRGLSPLDARFLLNLARLKGDELILDPFAGFGGIVLEARRRRLNIIASEVDVSLRMGLEEVSGGRCLIADARRLPFKSKTFDAVVTEPPYRREQRGAVIEAMEEICRVCKEEGPIVMLISQSMAAEAVKRLEELGREVKGAHPVRRHGGLICRAMLF